MTVVLVTAVGVARGSRAAAAALACAGSATDRAGLLIDLVAPRTPRSSLIATAAARQLEERLVAHLPQAGVASAGALCRVALPGDADGLEAVAAALPLVRGSAAVVHLPPRLLQAALDEPRVRPSAVALRGDLAEDRALVALAVRDLLERDLRAVVLKRPPGWAAGLLALLGALPGGYAGIPPRTCERALGQTVDPA